MKKFKALKASLLLIAILSTSANAWACGGKYEGSKEIALTLENKKLVCNYNGVHTNASVTVSTPRCLGAKPEVMLNGFEQNLEVTNIKSRRIVGVARAIVSYKLETTSSDGPIVCRAK